MNLGTPVKYCRENKKISAPSLFAGTLFFGPIYLMCCRMWMPAVMFWFISVVLFIVASLCPPLIGGWLAMPFFSGYLVRSYYLSQGWTEIFPDDDKILMPKPKRDLKDLERMIGSTPSAGKKLLRKVTSENSDSGTYKL